MAPYEGAATKPEGSVVPKDAVGGRSARTWRPRAEDLSPSPPTRRTRKTPRSRHTVSGHSDTDTYHRCWSLTTVASRAVVASGGAAKHRISHILQDAATGYFPTQGLQRLQSRIDLTIQDMNAVNRSYSRETDADFQPIDGGPPLPGRASHRRGTVKGAKQHKGGRDPPEDQVVATCRGGAMSLRPESV